MEKEKAFEIAKKIINLDLLRDELFESLIEIYGEQAYEILRKAQNGL